MTANFELFTTSDEYIRAAPDAHLSSPHSHLLVTLLAEEDQHDYNQILSTTLPHNIFHVLRQVTSPFTFITLSDLPLLVILISSAFIIHHMDNHHLTQKTSHSAT